jgi:F-type H+-transporting ATPase subunit alpha
MHYIAPMSGAAIAEYFRDNGENALVIFDDLTKHADSYREICLLMKRTPAREAYPGDIFYLHARLLERAVNMIDEKGGGSVTMLPIIETKAGDVSDYIPTSVISITDGQIYLDKELFLDGQKPGINIGLSVSRIGSAAQYKAMQKIAGRLKGELAQFREYEAFARSVADLDQETQTMLNRGRVLMNLFKQSVNNPSSFEKMIIILFAGIKGLLDNVEFKAGIESFENDLLAYMNEHEKALMEVLNRDHTFDDALEKNMTQAIKSFLEEKNKTFCGAKI